MKLIAWIAALAALSAAGSLWWRRRRRRASVRRVREALLQASGPGDRFDPDSLDTLPPAAAKYLRHALAAGAPLWRTADLRVRGRLRAEGSAEWLPFHARQRLSGGRGFLREGRISVLRRLDLEGAEWLVGDEAGSAWALAGWIPTLAEEPGDEASRSAAGRLLAELVWLPGELTPQRGAVWSGGDADTAVVTPAGAASPRAITVAEDGRLRSVSLVRRRPSTSGAISVAPWGLVFEDEGRFGDLSVPIRFRGIWGMGTDEHEEVLEADVDAIGWR
jgi:hypothetical protein